MPRHRFIPPAWARPLRALAAAAVFACSVAARPAPPSDPDPESAIRDALGELRAVESQIRAKLRDQTAKAEKANAGDLSAKLTEDFLSGGDQARKQGRKSLETIHVSLDRDLQAMSDAEAASRAKLAESRSGIELASSLALHQARAAGPGSPETLTLMLIHERQRQGAHQAIERALRLEELRDAREESREKIDAQIGLYKALGDLSVQKLRDRHRQLSSKLNKLYSETQQGRADAQNRGAQGKALNTLIADLGDAKKEEFSGWRQKGKDGKTQVAAAATPPPAPPEADAIPEVGYEDQTELALGAREGDGAPTVEMEIKPVGPTSPGGAFRQTFWRASSSAPRAFAPGKVLFSGAFSGFRHLLIIDHGDGWTMVYGNLTACELAEGDEVQPGEHVGHYKSGEVGDPQPLWVEARRETKPVAIDSFPPAGKDWMPKLFADSGL